MVNKYYTPSIEEFRVGFEYEILGLNNRWGKGDDSETPKYYLPNQAKAFRVKYLDREDIESLGFTFKDTNTMVYWYVMNNEVGFPGFNNDIPGSIGYTYWAVELKHDPEFNAIKIICTTSAGGDDTFFEGYCKNKSELVVLLKQLNIL